MRGAEIVPTCQCTMVPGEAILATECGNHMASVYIADSIRKTRWRKGGMEYLVKWKDWPSKFNTWEPETNILDVNLIKLFERRKARARQRKLAIRRGGGHGGSAASPRSHHTTSFKDGKKCSATKKDRATTKPKPLRPPMPAPSSGCLPEIWCDARTSAALASTLTNSTPKTGQATAEVNDRENESVAPPLDCLRGIKFKLGWRYKRPLMSGGELRSTVSPLGSYDVNAASPSSPGVNAPVVPEPSVTRESSEEATKPDCRVDSPLTVKGVAFKPPHLKDEPSISHHSGLLSQAHEAISSERTIGAHQRLAFEPASGARLPSAAETLPEASDDVIMEHRWSCASPTASPLERQSDVNNNSCSSLEGRTRHQSIDLTFLREHNVWKVKANRNLEHTYK